MKPRDVAVIESELAQVEARLAEIEGVADGQARAIEAVEGYLAGAEAHLKDSSKPFARPPWMPRHYREREVRDALANLLARLRRPSSEEALVKSCATAGVVIDRDAFPGPGEEGPLLKQRERLRAELAEAEDPGELRTYRLLSGGHTFYLPDGSTRTVGPGGTLELTPWQAEHGVLRGRVSLIEDDEERMAS